MQRATAVLGAALVVFATAVSAQEKPNFNGTWTLDAEKTAAANPNMGPSTAVANAKWDGNSIVIETTREFNGNTVTSRSVYTIEGDQLVIITTSPGRDGGEMTRKQFYKKS